MTMPTQAAVEQSTRSGQEAAEGTGLTAPQPPPPSVPRPPIYRLIYPFQMFARREASSGILLLFCAVLALFWANSPWAAGYTQLFSTEITIRMGSFVISKALLLWINDGLMAIFFFVVGLEIKREVLAGELSSLRQAALPVAAAIGGMVTPALFYMMLNAGGAGAKGWGIPMATDIAFALGVLALLGSRTPTSLKVFLAAFAIADDIGAVLVIALFYTAKITAGALALGFGFLALSALANWAGVRHPLVYTLLGFATWVAFLKSGVHATVAGVLLAMTIPARARIDPETFLARAHAVLERFERADDAEGDGTNGIRASVERQAALHTLEHSCERAQTPLHRLEHTLHPWVSFFVMPVFALANAGVALSGAGSLAHSIPLGILLGLVLGKPLGVTLFAWLAVRSRIADMPHLVTWRHVHGAAWLGGIGFTMALFIAELAFSDPSRLAAAKLGILCGSLVTGVVGYLILRGCAPIQPESAGED
jgi:NhaA family Na+:H+ antiporter